MADVATWTRRKGVRETIECHGRPAGHPTPAAACRGYAIALHPQKRLRIGGDGKGLGDDQAHPVVHHAPHPHVACCLAAHMHRRRPPPTASRRPSRSSNDMMRRGVCPRAPATPGRPHGAAGRASLAWCMYRTPYMTGGPLLRLLFGVSVTVRSTSGDGEGARRLTACWATILHQRRESGIRHGPESNKPSVPSHHHIAPHTYMARIWAVCD
ncbi:hypothetical protein LX36DRAFT_251713 [Colletotrichum falcatum]|nr:hypothetical protein LX36DRAFT_251713 [Colletotrichum falcatum]